MKKCDDCDVLAPEPLWECFNCDKELCTWCAGKFCPDAPGGHDTEFPGVPEEERSL